jgi:Putative auto-transporter adhesin, head GIN domain
MNRFVSFSLAFAVSAMLVSTPLSAQTFITDLGRAVNNLFAPRIVGSGNVVNETREFAPFHTVRVDAPFGVDVDCAEGGQPSVAVQADDNIVPLISTTLKDGILTISLSNEVSSQGFASRNLRVVVSAPTTERVELLGAGSIEVTHVYRPALDLYLAGVGSIVASGTTQNLTIDAHGVGAVEAKHVRAQNVNVASHGIGSVSVYAASKLDINLGGIGSLVYYGNPQFINKNAGGIGSVSKGSARFEP